jgi:hypothetical protein
VENGGEEANGKETNDNLIYRFDEEDQEKEKQAEGEEDEKKEGEEKAADDTEDEYDKEHDEYEERFLEVDNQLIFLQPFLIGYIICNNIMQTGYISLILIILSLILFLVFNLKGVCGRIKWLSFLFMLPAVFSFVPTFIGSFTLPVAIGIQ